MIDMKNTYIGFIALLFLLSTNAMAYHDRAWNTAPNDNRTVNASGCSRGATSTTIEFNNVRALIHTGGDMWWDLVGTAKYEVPKGSGKTALFAGAIWIGGTDVNDQLRLAAVKFRSGGVDYWPGPLIVSGMDRATVTPDVCAEYDKHFVVTRQEVSDFRAYINAVLAGDSQTLQNEFENYTIPDIITEWPGNGDAARGYDFYLAPYVDNDASGDYNPESGGDYPFFDLDGKEPCGTSRALRKPRLYGDQTMWWVYNDRGNVHGETNGEAIGMEIRAQYFAFATADELNNMTFGNYALINRSTYTLYNTYFGVWTDADLGDATDDYVGCDVTRGLGYLYNGTERDGNGNGQTYGDHPPAIGVDFFEGPYMDPWIDVNGDTLDRPSTYLFDSNGNQTSEIDESMPRDTTPTGLYNGGINGLNYGDGIPGNERWGMRRYLYFNNSSGNQGDPEKAQQYYNYLDGLWKDRRILSFGGNGYLPSGGVKSNFMFPGKTDPYNWSTNGAPTGYPSGQFWTEGNEANAPGDRRFVQSAGPFTLQPGAVNDITVGMVWARATSGGAFESVKKVQEADDKAQKLFDNCFVMIDGPDSPELKITELDGELIFQIFNIKGQSNNYKISPEDYEADDPFIVCPIDTAGNSTDCDTKYRFQGYQVFQLKNASVTNADIDDPTFARLVFQSDIVDGVSTLINYVSEPITGKLQPQLMVVGADKGIKHTFTLTEDAFATSDKGLVNHKKYYYLAVAYAYNQYKLYDPEDGTALDGQKITYLRGRKSASGSIKTFMGMPHINKIQDGGVLLNSSYGDGVEVTLVEGMGCGNNILNLKEETINEIMSGSPWRVDRVVYAADGGPIKVSVVDPLNVKNDTYVLRFDSVEYNTSQQNLRQNGYIDQSKWYISPKANDGTLLDTTIYVMYNDSMAVAYDTTLSIPMVIGIENVLNSYDAMISEGTDTFKITNPISSGLKLYPLGTIFSETAIQIENEQIIPNLGIAITIQQVHVPGPGPRPGVYDNTNYRNGYLYSEVTYKDPSMPWLTNVSDGSGENLFNWIRTGIVDVEDGLYNSNKAGTGFVDPSNDWENITDGLVVPYRVCAYDQIIGSNVLKYQPAYDDGGKFTTGQGKDFDKFRRTSSVDIVITKDTNLWSRCPVVEMCESDTMTSGSSLTFIAGPSEGGAEKFRLRKSRSVYRNGKPMPIAKIDSFWVHDQYFMPDSGMGWFPGYAIDVETGERLNIFFGEDSRWGAFNGRDMLWNPSDKMATDLYNQTGGAAGELVFGAKHNFYVWGHSYADTTESFTSNNIKFASCGYDEGQRLFAYLSFYNDPLYSNSKALDAAWNNIIYTGRPMLNSQFVNYDKEVDPYGFISTDITIKIRMANPYRGLGFYLTGSKKNNSSFLKPDSLALNNNAPMFEFTTVGMGATTNNEDIAKDALDNINVVPNPYYAYDSYELKQTQKLIKFTNLPEECTISVYNLGGNLVRKFDKSSPLTYLDWDLKNEYGIEIAGGVYIIHIMVPGVGEKVLKWFGTLRPIDLDHI